MDAVKSLGSGRMIEVASYASPQNGRKLSSWCDGTRATENAPVFVRCKKLYSKRQQSLVAVGGVSRSTHANSENSMPKSLRTILRDSDGASAAKYPNSANYDVHYMCRCQRTPHETEREEGSDDSEEKSGVRIALAALRFYKREISPLLPGSCRYVPTCSEYSMQAYQKYGVVKGTILTACRISRCNPLGGSGFDPPRWFGESKPPPA